MCALTVAALARLSKDRAMKKARKEALYPPLGFVELAAFVAFPCSMEGI